MKITPADEQAPRLGRVLLGTRLVQNDKHEYTKNYYSSTDFPLLLLVRSAFVPALPSTLCCRDHFCVYIFVYRRVSRNKKSFQWGKNIHAKIWRCFSPEVECCIWNIFVVIVYGLMFILWCNICSEQMRAAEYLPSGSSVSYVIIGWSLVNGSVSFGPYLQCENTEIVPLSEETIKDSGSKIWVTSVLYMQCLFERALSQHQKQMSNNRHQLTPNKNCSCIQVCVGGQNYKYIRMKSVQIRILYAVHWILETK